jgi:cyanophycinase
VVEPGHDVGFGLLKGVAVDQHLIARQREGKLERVIQAYPQLLGIGLDEGAALVIQGDVARVEGESLVGIWDKKALAYPLPFRWLKRGDRYDLARRERLRNERVPVDLPTTF